MTNIVGRFIEFSSGFCMFHQSSRPRIYRLHGGVKRRDVTRSFAVAALPESNANKRKDRQANSDYVVCPQRHWTEKVEQTSNHD
jgi:hypothetical protein